MYKFDFFFDELCATSNEAKDKSYNRQIDKENIKMIISKLEVLLGNNIDGSICNLRSAFNQLEDYIYIAKYERTNEILIINIERILLNCIGLKPDLLTGCIKNSDLLAFSYYGLCLVNIIRKKDYLAERYIMKMFSVSPRIARNDLAPRVYEDYFKPKIDDNYKYQYRIIQDDPRIYSLESKVDNEVVEVNVEDLKQSMTGCNK